MVLVTLLTSPALEIVTPEEAEMPTENPILSDEECLKERKWWCFLLSSIFTFLMGVLSVVVVRGITSICCHKDEDEFSQVSYFFYFWVLDFWILVLGFGFWVLDCFGSRLSEASHQYAAIKMSFQK